MYSSSLYSDLVVSVLACSFSKGYLEEMQNLLNKQLKHHHLSREVPLLKRDPGTHLKLSVLLCNQSGYSENTSGGLFWRTLFPRKG